MKGASENTAAQVLSTLRKLVRPDKAVFLPKFFQAMPGGYGEGDQFLGVVVPDQRKTAKQFRALPLGQIQQLLDSPWHECRLTGLFVLVDQFDEILRLSKRLLGDQHDLMHKAIGWMLREMGEQDANMLTDFLELHVHRMPRTMLRYAIEKRAPTERKFWLNLR